MSTPSVAAQVIVTIVPIVGIICGCMVIFFYLYWNYQLKKLMIEKGNYQRSAERFDYVTFSLLSGLVLTGVGFSMVLFFYLKDGICYGLLGGLLPLSVGLGLIVFFIINSIMNKREDGRV
ncbi:MAG TPA: hypothetical protein PK200_00795 [Spirochaetota bacterium]|nr:hypothetical protein [Spirochaetota bacterium]HQO03251.1 hypothetical protein [Spirochaetota bacterium]HQP48601.1 hypothetical protein [Spirochaetota bacterium]